MHVLESTGSERCIILNCGYSTVMCIPLSGGDFRFDSVMIRVMRVTGSRLPSLWRLGLILPKRNNDIIGSSTWGEVETL